LTTSQIGSRIEYVIPTDKFQLLFYTQIFILIAGFQYDLMLIKKWLTFYWATMCKSSQVHKRWLCHCTECL